MELTKERPIFSNAESVGGILDDRKTQTRRVVKKQPPVGATPCFDEIDYYQGTGWFFQYPKDVGSGIVYNSKFLLPNKGQSPYGKIGDRLWCKETWSHGCNDFGTNRKTIHYKADGLDHKGHCWSPSIFMFRKYSRILLEITHLKIERIQDISEADAIAEGIEREYANGKDIGWKNYLWHGHYGQYGRGNKQSDNWEHQYSTYDDPKGCFSSLWESINAKPKPVMSGKKIVSYISYPWEDIRETREHRGLKWVVCGNPHVWAVTFKVLKKEV